MGERTCRSFGDSNQYRFDGNYKHLAATRKADRLVTTSVLIDPSADADGTDLIALAHDPVATALDTDTPPRKHLAAKPALTPRPSIFAPSAEID